MNRNANFQASVSTLLSATRGSEEKLVVSNGSKRIVRNSGDNNWIASRVDSAGRLSPGVYELHKAMPARVEDTTYSGTILHVDERHVYQQTTGSITRHERAAFATLPEIGRRIRVAYESGQANIEAAHPHGTSLSPLSPA